MVVFDVTGRSMNEPAPDPDHKPKEEAPVSANDMQRRDDAKFKAEMDILIQEAEDLRLNHMRRHRGRNFMFGTMGMISLLAGASGFGWFLLVDPNIAMGVLCIMAATIPPIILHFWAHQPLKDYVRDHKNNFMPKMAKALGGLKFHPARGVSSKILSKTGVIPAHDIYKAEDCFMGAYKGVKVIFSEARLYAKKNHSEPVFDGIFVLLEIPNKVIEGHTIITADGAMVKKWASSRWQKLQNVSVSVSNPDWNRFQVFSDAPEAASLLVGEKLLKELSEASDIFDKAPLTAVLFRGKFVFLTIPYEADMFEASNIFVPVTTKQHALQCKKEIEQILEIIDVFEIYKPATRTENPETQG